MKVKKLYILCLDDYDISEHDSVVPSALALMVRNAGKLGAENVTLLRLNPKHTPHSENYREPLGADFEKELAAIRGSSEQNVGIYIVGHGELIRGHNVGHLLMVQLAELVAEIGFPAVRKICIESCNMKPSFLQEFCNKLYAKTSSGARLRPMVAGYLQFVSVVGSNATKGKGVYDIGWTKEIKFEWNTPALLGKKVVKASQLGIGSPHFFKEDHNVLLRSVADPDGARDATALKKNKIVAQHDGTSANMIELELYEKR